jgi:hypothetical protein
VTVFLTTLAMRIAQALVACFVLNPRNLLPFLDDMDAGCFMWDDELITICNMGKVRFSQQYVGWTRTDLMHDVM